MILSGQSRDEVLDTIHNRLRDLGDEMRNGKINLEEYEINRVGEIEPFPPSLVDLFSNCPKIRAIIPMRRACLTS